MWIIGGINCKLNISANPNLYLKIFKSMNQGTKWILLVKITKGQTSHAGGYLYLSISYFIFRHLPWILRNFSFLFAWTTYIFFGGGGRAGYSWYFYLSMSSTENDDDKKMFLFTLCVCRDTSTSYARWSRTSPWVLTPRARRSGMSSETFQ